MLAVPAGAQMKAGAEMQNFNEAFNLKGAPGSGSYVVSYRGCTVSPSNILYPGDQPEFDFQLQNKTGQAIVADGTAELISFGTKGLPDDVWTPSVFSNGVVQSLPVHANIPANGTQELKLTFNVPEKKGGYAVVFDLGPNGRAWGTSMARTFPASKDIVPLPKMMLDAQVGLDGLNRLGVGSVRRELGFAPGNQDLMKQIDQTMQDYQDHHITCLIVWGGASGSKQPGGIMGRPWLGDDDTGISMAYDNAWLPEQDNDFRKWVGDVAKKWGYPKGPVVGVELWNEPWEGDSISGWGADMLRYREIFTKMAEGIEDARAQGAQVMITGTDSSTNSWDKLFCDGTDDFLKWFDACTIHYQGIAAPSLYKKWLNRKGPYGRVKIWDTESWVANTDDRVATTVALDRAAGYDRGMGVFGGDVTTPQDNGAYEAWPLAASVGAVQYFVGERNFKELLFKKGLPWIFVFDGLNGNEDDGTVVVSGDIGENIGEDHLLFRNVRGLKEMQDKEALRAQLAALPAGSPEAADLQQKIDKPEVLSGGMLTIPAIPHAVAYDFYGNEVAPVDSQIQIPLNFRGYYLRTDGTPGSFAQLLAALRTARIDGYEPVEIIARDAVQPLDKGGTFHLSVTNILNRPVQGTLQATVPGLNVDAPGQLSFAPFETKQIDLAVKGAPSSSNSYPLRVVFDAGADGKAIHAETMHVNQIARRTITVDGRLDDWQGVLPQSVAAAGKGGPTLTESAWLPFKNFASDLKAGVATSYLAYDDKYFYFAAKIADSTPDDGVMRFAHEDSDQFFYPEVFYNLDPSRNPGSMVADWKPANAAEAPRSSASDPNARIAKSWQSGSNAGIELVLQAPTDKPAQLAIYFPGGQHGIARLQFVDNVQGPILMHRDVSISGGPTYAVFNVKGSLHVTIRVNRGAVAVAGLFIDDAPASKIPADQTNAAEFVALDTSTLGNWPEKYGKSGHWLAGEANPQLPGSWQQLLAGALVKYNWPDGVRRYTYRKDPFLPTGNSPNCDNVQIGFNVLPAEDKDTIPNPPGTMPNFVPGQDTDYEFALNKVAAKYGGGTEIWRLRVPGMPSKNFYPREPWDPKEGAVTRGKLVVTRTATTRIVEAAIPWSEIPEVEAAANAGKTIKFTYRINDNQGVAMELANGRSVSKINPHSLHTDWTEHWSNEVEFGFEKASSR